MISSNYMRRISQVVTMSDAPSDQLHVYHDVSTDASDTNDELDTVRVSRETLHRLYGATRLHVENDGECFTADTKALREAERVLGKDGPYRGER